MFATFMHWTAKAICIYFADIVFNIMKGSAMELCHHMHYTTIQVRFYSRVWKKKKKLTKHFFLE